MADRAKRWRVTGPVVGLVATWLAACDEPAALPVCQLPGQLGAGAFAAHDCRYQAGCLDGWRFAARSVETMIFCPGAGEEVTDVSSSDPSVMVATTPLAADAGRVEFDLRAGGPGRATIEVRGPALLERLELVVEDLATVEIAPLAPMVVGGKAAITSHKAGASGAPLFGRGGYGLTVPAGLSTRPATTATQDCALDQPDVVITADVVGSYRVATDSPALPWTATIDVVPAASVRSVEFVATRIAGSAATGFAASVRVVGRDAAGHAIRGVACEWSAARPVFIAGNVCWSLILLSTDEPLDLACRFDGRDLGSVRLSNAITI